MYRWFIVAILACSTALVTGCGRPLFVSDAAVTSSPRPQSVETSVLAGEMVATLVPIAPAALQGYSPMATLSLSSALSEASRPINNIPAYETVSRLNGQGLAADYADMMSDFGRGGILDRPRLTRIGTALGAKYVLLPGVADFSQTLTDRLDLAGWKVFKNRVIYLKLWLQLWDTRRGQLLWESAGEVIVASEIFKEQVVPIHAISKRLWLRMIEDLLGGRTKSLIHSLGNIFTDGEQAPKANGGEQ